ncbi:MAG: hypothetical protein JXB24_00590, partial [Bacteroidales bacterium]|nr:hypothetical protein [Bacteroidales bacterium]
SIRGDQSGALRINSGNGYIDIGAKNTANAHLVTDRNRFYFNKEIWVNSGKIGSYDEHLSLHTAGSTKMTLTTEGNVGIGTTSPTSKLHVIGDINFTGELLKNGIPVDLTGGDNSFWLQGSGGIYNNTANVGIGNTDPSFKLDVSGDINFTGQLRYQGNPVSFETGGGDSYWDPATGGIHYDGGNIGIGTNTPTASLHLHIDDFSNSPNIRISKIGGDQGGNFTEVWNIKLDRDNLRNSNALTFYHEEVERDNSYKVAQFTSDGCLLIKELRDMNNQGYFIKPANTNTSLKVAGKVGIGLMAGPSASIHIASEHPDILLDNNSDTDFGSEINFADNGTIESRITFNKYNRDLVFENDGNQAMIIERDGRVKINGNLQAEEIEVINNVVPDYVFKKDYELRTIKEVETFIAEYGHLPGVPSEDDVIEQGSYNLGKMNILLLEKIEELTLYMIELKKENEQQKQQIEELLKINNLK